MPKKSKKDAVLTVGKFKSIFDSKFNDLKDFVKSSAKALETVLKKEMQDFKGEMRGEHRLLKTELKNEIQSVKYELKGDICKLEKRLENTEARLSDKIDAIGASLDEHKTKPAAIAHPA